MDSVLSLIVVGATMAVQSSINCVDHSFKFYPAPIAPDKKLVLNQNNERERIKAISLLSHVPMKSFVLSGPIGPGFSNWSSKVPGIGRRLVKMSYARGSKRITDQTCITVETLWKWMKCITDQTYV